MTTRYRFDPPASRFTARAYAGGLLSFIGHSPTFAVREFGGTVEFPDDLIANLRLELTVGAGSLAPGGEMRPSDRQEIEGRMRAEVLETAAFPEIKFRAAAAGTEKLGPGTYRVILEGTLVLRGVSRPHRLAAELTMFQDGLRLRGDTTVRMSAFGIPPVTALAGAVRLEDEVKLSFDLAARPEGS